MSDETAASSVEELRDLDAPERRVARFLSLLALLIALGLAGGLGWLAWKTIARRTGPPYLEPSNEPFATPFPGGMRVHGAIQSVAYNTQGFTFIAGGGEIHMRFPMLDGEMETPVDTGTRGVSCVALPPSGGPALIAGPGFLQLVPTSAFGMRPAAARPIMKTDLGEPRALALSPDERFAAAGGPLGGIEVWDTTATPVPKRRASLAGHTGAVKSVALSPDGTRVLSCGEDGTIRLWSTRGGSLVETLEGAKGEASFVLIFPDGDRLLAVGAKGVRIWTQPDARDAVALDMEGLSCAAISPDSSLVAVGGARKLAILRADTLALVQTINAGEETVTCVAFSQDGKALLAGTEKGRLLGEWVESK